MAFGLLYDYLMGQSIDAYKYFGAHFEKRDGVSGVVFRLYAPMASDVSVIGEFNNWDVTTHKMNKVDDAGVYELFIPGFISFDGKYGFLTVMALGFILRLGTLRNGCVTNSI